jgi:hypothetical protein
MHSSILAKIFFFLSVLHLAVAASEIKFEVPAAQLEVRQVSTTPSQAELCLDYERTANMSTIGANSTYRTVLMQKANVGTIYSARMMDAAIAKLPALTADRTLNSACGNWTEIALKEAEANFTQGIVAQFTTDGLPVGIYAGPVLIPIFVACCAIMSVVWIFSG